MASFFFFFFLNYHGCDPTIMKSEHVELEFNLYDFLSCCLAITFILFTFMILCIVYYSFHNFFVRYHAHILFERLAPLNPVAHIQICDGLLR